MQSTQCQSIRPADLTPNLITERHHRHHHHYRVTINNSTIYTVPSEPLRLTHFGNDLEWRKRKENLAQWILAPKSWFTHGLWVCNVPEATTFWLGRLPLEPTRYHVYGPRTATTILWSAVIIIFYCVYIPPRHRQEECMNAPGRKPNRGSRRLQLSYEAGKRGKGREGNGTEQ